MAVEDPESNDLLDYFRDVILMTAARLQSWTEEKVEAVPDSVPESCDDFGNELLECITGMSPQEVHISVDVCYYQRSMRILLCYYIGWLFSEAWYIPKDARNLHQVRSCPWTLK